MEIGVIVETVRTLVRDVHIFFNVQFGLFRRLVHSFLSSTNICSNGFEELTLNGVHESVMCENSLGPDIVGEGGKKRGKGECISYATV